VIADQVKHSDDPKLSKQSLVVTELVVEKGRKFPKINGKCNGQSYGKADLALLDEDHKTLYIWEVKSQGASRNAASEVAWYMKQAKANNSQFEGWSVEPGFRLSPDAPCN
jgi:hypothetical protein